MNLREALEECLRKRPFVEEALQDDLINLSSLARAIKPDIEYLIGKEIKESAVVMAIRRREPKLQLKMQHKLQQFISSLGDIIVRSNLVAYTYKKTPALTAKQAIFLEAIKSKPSGFHSFTGGMEETTVVISEDFGTDLEHAMAGETQLGITKDLSSITLRLLIVTVTGSRGCVRKCTFCDVAGLWKKYRYRPGSDIANEIVEMYHKYGIDFVNFSDSLVKGSMKAFREFCIALAEANVPVKWRGMAIFRSGMTQSDWDMIKASGCEILDVGIESGSERVRFDMNKKFTNECMYDSIDQLGKRGIRMTFLMMAGYPTETVQDHQETLKLLRWAGKYKELIEVRMNIVMVVRNTPLYEDLHWYDYAETWRYENSDGELTFAERYRRWKESIETIKQVGLIPDNRQFQLEDVFKIRLEKELGYDHSKVKGVQIPLDQSLPPMDSLVG